MALTDGDALEVDGVVVDGKQAIKKATKLDIATNVDASLLAGRISYDPNRKTHLFHTGFGIKIDAGEVHIPFFNDTGSTLLNGKAINVAGTSPVNEVLKGMLADASSLALSSAVIGINSADVLDQEMGMATLIGRVSDFDTSGLSEGGIVYLSDITAGELSNTRPQYPSNIIIIGSCIKSDASVGLLQAKVTDYERINVSIADSFSSQGTGAGTFYAFGHYDWSATDANLTQALTSVSYGVANRTQAAHIGIVPAAAGVVDTGQVGLRVTGILDSEISAQQSGQTAIITEDITTLTADTMIECSGKFSGNVTIELYVVSGSPVNYSLDFNYGFSKYSDFFNNDASLVGFSARWWGDANDNNMEIEVIHHKPSGWTYSAAGFVPGATPIVKRSDRQQLAGHVDLGAGGAWKVTNINQFLESGGAEGVIVRVTTTASNTFLNCFFNIAALSEELT